VGNVSPTLFATESAIPLSRLEVTEVVSDGQSAVISRPREEEVVLGQTVLFLAGAEPMARGTLSAQTNQRALVTINHLAVLPTPGDAAVFIPGDLGRRLRAQLPETARLWGRILAVDDETKRCRLSLKPEDGFQTGDRLLALRNDYPIARVDLRRLDADLAEADYVPLVANAHPEAGDQVRLAQTPQARRSGRLHARILRVEDIGSDQEVWFPLEDDAGVRSGDCWIAREGGDYVGVLRLREFRGPFAVGVTINAAGRRPLRVGDVVWRRVPRDVREGRTPLQIFRVEGDYCLLNAGEEDGVTHGARLSVYRRGMLIGRVVISTVKVDFCGARLESQILVEASGDTDEHLRLSANNVSDTVFPILAVGDDAYLADGQPLPEPLGFVADVRQGLGTVKVGLSSGRTSVCEGDVLEIVGDPWSAVGIVIAATGEEAVLFVPPFCQPGPIVVGSPVRAVGKPRAAASGS
jgi:hypothetical protein